MTSAVERERTRADCRPKRRKTCLRRLSAVAVVLSLAITLAGCGHSVTQASFTMKDSSSASLLQWTETGHTVSGSLALATLDNATLDTKNLAFAGTISGSSVTLTFPQGFGTRTNVVGTVSGSHLHISLPSSEGPLIDVQYTSGTVANYNRAVAVLASQTDKVRDSSVQWGIRSLQIGIQSYAVDNNDRYPTGVTQSSLSSYVDNWPKNPYTGAPMASGTDAGDYSYSSDGTSFQLVGYGSEGTQVITVP
jgi:hypothetical protein